MVRQEPRARPGTRRRWSTRAFEEFATGRFTKEEVLDTCTRLGLRTRQRLALNPAKLRPNAARIGCTPASIDMPEFGVSTRGDFDPLVSEETFYRVQAILEGRIQVTGTAQRESSGLSR